LGGNNS